MVQACTNQDMREDKVQDKDSWETTNDLDKVIEDAEVDDFSESTNNNESTRPIITEDETIEDDTPEDDSYTYINSSGTTIETRIKPPQGYKRVEASPDTFLHFLRNLELKDHDSPVILYNGNEKSNQKAQAAVFGFDIGDKDLQQCADSIIRVYSEYYWSSGQYEKIKFHLTNGFLMDYENWRNGKRIKVDGNNVSWVDSAAYDDSYENFRNYLTSVMIYAGTQSLDNESTLIDLSELRQGDMLLIGGSPGHCVLVVDLVQDENGDTCYLLAQGYMPAQDFHVLKNPNKEDCPWYFKEDLSGNIRTPEYGFTESDIKRWNNGLE